MAPSMERAARGTKDTRLLTNQPYDESLEVIDSEEVASVYSPTPCGGHSQVTRQPGDRGTGGPGDRSLRGLTARRQRSAGGLSPAIITAAWWCSSEIHTRMQLKFEWLELGFPRIGALKGFENNP